VKEFLRHLTRVLREPLTLPGRGLVLLAALSLIPTFLLPLWSMDFWSQQYPDGLKLFIYSHALVGGDGGNDLTEINVLNHYIGMAALQQEDFLEFKWIPLVVGIIAILTLRAAAIGTLAAVVDVAVFSVYFALFSLWGFYYKLSYYGANLDPRAAVKVDPFTPPILGFKMVGQFKVWSYPAAGTYFFLIFGALLLVAVALSRPWQRRDT